MRQSPTHSVNDSDFVIDEANKAKDKLIPISIGDIGLPTGFGKLHTIKWEGNNYTEEELNELVRHLIYYIGEPEPKEIFYKLDISVSPSEQTGVNYPLKLKFSIQNWKFHCQRSPNSA